MTLCIKSVWPTWLPTWEQNVVPTEWLLLRVYCMWLLYIDLLSEKFLSFSVSCFVFPSSHPMYRVHVQISEEGIITG